MFIHSAPLLNVKYCLKKVNSKKGAQMKDIYKRYQLNKTSSINTPEILNREDKLNILGLLERKHRLIKFILGITTKRQHKNLMQRYNKKGRRVSGHNKPRLLEEYVRVGGYIRELTSELSKVKAR